MKVLNMMTLRMAAMVVVVVLLVCGKVLTMMQVMRKNLETLVYAEFLSFLEMSHKRVLVYSDRVNLPGIQN